MDQKFHIFWNLYQKKVGLFMATRAWNKLGEDEKEMAIEQAPKYVLATPDIKYRCHASTWLNQKRFLDHIEPSKPNDPFLNVALDIVKKSENGSTDNRTIRSIY